MNKDRPCCWILVLEDSPLDLFLIRSALQEVLPPESHILEADRLSQAVAILRNEQVDLVFSDLNLPDSLGSETVRALLRCAPGVPVWALTGYTDAFLEEGLAREGAAGCISKDHLDAALLYEAVASAVQHRPAFG